MRIRQHVGNVDIRMNTDRLHRNAREAQKLLNMQVVADCDPLIPFQQGALRNSVNYPGGVYGTEIEWNTPYAHYQYESIVYSPNIPIKDSEGNITGWFSPPGQKKKPTNRTLTYHHPGTTGHWFEEAKKAHKNDWVKLVKETAGKG
ncbi:MAG: hypothetical protein HFI70_04005 [Lachnospiraceae bacterium]|nr:hypothetical protein [Lachnospiraceae bacterium]